VGGLAIDHQVEPRGLLDWKVTRCRALENFIDERWGAAEEIRNVLTVAHQPAGLRVFAQRKNRRQSICEREFGNSLTLLEENSVDGHHDRLNALLSKRDKRLLDFPRVACRDRHERKADLLGGSLRIVEDGGVGLGVWIAEQSDAGNVRHN